MTLWLRVGVGIGRGPGSSPAGDKEWKKKKKAFKKRKFFFLHLGWFFADARFCRSIRFN